MSDPTRWTLCESLAKLDSGEVTSRQLTQKYLDRIKNLDGRINSYITVDTAGALRQADVADAQRAAGEKAALLGVPLALKDLLVTDGLKTTCGSKILENFVPPYDAFVTSRLKDAGAVILGKTNMDEFAMGSSNETSWFGPVANPWDETKIPGGSSGGSAAAVAADLCVAALGSDTGGSIRQPASLCGIVGLKPTYGRISRFGLVAFASSLDQIGPMTRDVRDAALLMNVIAGYDERDSTCADEPTIDYTATLDDGVAGMTIGVPKEYFVDGMDPDVERKVRDAIARLAEGGATIREISLPHTSYSVPTYYVLAPAEASSNLSRYDAVKFGYRATDTKNLLDMYEQSRRDGFGPEVKRRIMLGTYALSSGYYDAYYLKAQKVRTLVRRDFVNAFREVDLIVSPTAPGPAFGKGERTDDPLTMYLCDIFTISANLAGIPALSLPVGFTADKLPIGLQLMGNFFDEGRLLQAARAVELTAGVVGERPSLS